MDTVHMHIHHFINSGVKGVARISTTALSPLPYILAHAPCILLRHESHRVKLIGSKGNNL